MAYVYVNRDTEALDAINESGLIKQVLHWIGFTDNTQKINIHEDYINSYSDLYSFTQCDIADMAKDYANCNTTNGRIHFRIYVAS